MRVMHRNTLAINTKLNLIINKASIKELISAFPNLFILKIMKRYSFDNKCQTDRIFIMINKNKI